MAKKIKEQIDYGDTPERMDPSLERKISSPDVQVILNAQQQGTLLPLFVKKDDDEGVDFYFIGFLSYIEGSAQETLMQTDAGPVSVVKIDFRINKPVENGLYKYLVNI